jgi:hypothetical protein
MIEEATAATEDTLARLPRIHPAQRPHRYLARALVELGRHAEAVEYARAAYRQAWADGPPNCHHWDLRSARQLLTDIGEPIPDLPVTDPTDLKVPLEDKIRAFIAKPPIKDQHGGAGMSGQHRLATVTRRVRDSAVVRQSKRSP